MQLKTPKVSVVMPAFQAEDFISNSIQSVLNQQYTDLEVIVVNDGSTDKTESIVRQIQTADTRVVLINSKNEGMAAARQKAIKVAKGEWIAFLDADDNWENNKLKVQFEAIESYSPDVIISSGQYFGDVNKKWSIPSFLENGNQVRKRLLEKNFFPLLSALVRKELIKSTSIFELDRYYDIVADYHMWLTLTSSGKVNFLSLGKDFLFNYRIHQNQSTDHAKETTNLEVIIDLFEEMLNRKIVTLKEFKKLLSQHYKMAVDNKLDKGEKKEAYKILNNYKERTQSIWIANAIKVLIVISSRIAQKISWRLI